MSRRHLKSRESDAPRESDSRVGRVSRVGLEGRTRLESQTRLENQTRLEGQTASRGTTYHVVHPAALRIASHGLFSLSLSLSLPKVRLRGGERERVAVGVVQCAVCWSPGLLVRERRCGCEGVGVGVGVGGSAGVDPLTMPWPHDAGRVARLFVCACAGRGPRRPSALSRQPARNAVQRSSSLISPIELSLPVLSRSVRRACVVYAVRRTPVLQSTAT